MSVLNRIVKVASSLLREVTRTERRGRAAGSSRRPPQGGHDQGGQGGQAHGDDAAAAHTTVPYEGELPRLEYAPQADDDADPGEIVWAWVPYDENDGRGKDRPVLVIARHRGGFLGLQTTSKDHDRDAEDEARWGRYWFDIGSGDWDSQGRESEVRLDRVLYLPQEAVRREGAGLARERFEAVSAALRAHRAEHGS